MHDYVSFWSSNSFLPIFSEGFYLSVQCRAVQRHTTVQPLSWFSCCSQYGLCACFPLPFSSIFRISLLRPSPSLELCLCIGPPLSSNFVRLIETIGRRDLIVRVMAKFSWLMQFFHLLFRISFHAPTREELMCAMRYWSRLCREDDVEVHVQYFCALIASHVFAMDIMLRCRWRDVCAVEHAQCNSPELMWGLLFWVVFVDRQAVGQ